MTRTLPRNLTNASTEYVPFDVRDRMGRYIGASVYTCEVDFVDAPEAQCYYTTPAGHYFSFEPHATRNEKHYGAAQPRQHFATAEERAQAIKQYLEAARKRASKA